jgi:cytochrome c oxidase subunit II
VRSNRRSRWAKWSAIPLGLAVAVVLAGCTQEQLQGWLPGDAETTNHTGRIIGLWTTSWIVLLAVGLVTWGLVIWAAVVYRRRRGQTGLPVQLRYNMPIEIFYTIVPLILVIGFFAFTARDQAAIEADPGNPDVTIEVYGKRWAWDFNYLSENVYSQGIQAQVIDENGNIDQDELPVLYLPVNKKVEIEIESRDVIHSFWIIDFLYKKDMIPGKTNYMYFTPTKIGEYQGKCAELCGEYHSLMLFTVKVVSQEDFDAYLATLKPGTAGAEYDTNTNLPGTGARDNEEESHE